MPLLGRSKPAKIPNNVVLPALEGPTIATLSPTFISKDIWCRMFNCLFVALPDGVAIDLEILTALIMGSIILKVCISIRNLLFIFILYYACPLIAKPTIVILGDSLSAAHGIPVNDGWATLLSNKLAEKQYSVVNASRSGATTTDGLRTLPDLLRKYPRSIVILALGSNDALRGMPILGIKNNLSKMITEILADKSRVLLVGFQLPPNYGAYAQQFAQIYPSLAKKFTIPLVPFLLDGFADDLGYFQEDEMHPTIEAQPLILKNVYKYLEPMLDGD